MANPKGSPIIVFDQASIDKFGVHANALGWPHNDLHLVNDNDVLQLILTVLAQQKNDYIGVSSIDVDADLDRFHLYGVLSSLVSKGIGDQAFFDVHFEHPATADTLDDSVRVVGLHFNITVDAPERVQMRGTIRTVKNQGPITHAPQWVLAHNYVAGNYVEHGGVLYLCYNANTSSSTNEPGVGATWQTYWQIP